MRITPEIDTFINANERAMWLTPPFDLDAPPAKINGAPTICSLNAFEPASYMKTPRGDLIITNGIDPPRLWDGYLPSAWLAGIAAPTAAPTVTVSAGGGASAGTYACYIRFLDDRGQPSSLSPVASVTAAAGDKFEYLFPTATSSDGRVTTIQIWRSIEINLGPANAANVLYLIGTITDQTQTTYTDTLSDDQLIANAVADVNSVMNILNPDGSLNANRFTPPPRIKKVGVFYQSRAFYMADVAYTKGAVNVTHGSKTVVGVGAGWTDSFIGDWFYGIGAPAGYEIGSVDPDAGPVQISVAGNAATNCVQGITFPNQPTAGTWRAGLSGAWATGLSYAISAADLQAALCGVSTIGPDGVTVTGSVAAGFVVTFVNQNAAKAIALLDVDGTQLKGTDAIAVARVQAGGGGSGDTVNQIQIVGFSMLDNTTGSPDAALPSGSAAGNWLAMHNASGASIPVHQVGGAPNQMADAATATAALETILGVGNVQATPMDTLPFAGTGQILYRVELIGSLAGTADQNLITADVSTVANDFVGTVTVTPQAYLVQEGGSSSGGGSGALNEIQTITLPAGTAGGTFTISPDGCTTAGISWAADGDVVEAALDAGCGANFSVTGEAGGPWTVEFTGLLAGHPQPLMTCSSSSLLGVEIDVAVTTPGAAAENCVQTLSFGGATGGTATLSFNGSAATAALAFDITAADLQTAFTGLSTVGANNCQVTGGNGHFTFTFINALGSSSQPLIVCDVAGLTSYQGTSTVTLLEEYGGPTESGVIYCIRPAPEERNQIYYSEDNEPESVPTINTIKLQQFTNVDDEIVGGMIHGPFMFVLLSSHIVRGSYSKLPGLDAQFALACQRGAFNNRCWDYIDDTAFLMDTEGAYMFDGDQVQPISQQIEDLWRDGSIDFSQSKQFWVRAYALEETVRFGVCFTGDTYPQRVLCYNYRLQNWWVEPQYEPMGAAVVLPVGSRRRLVYGGPADQFYLTGQGYADGVDSETEAGTLFGTATSATSSSITDTTATFTKTMVGSPVAIVDGTGKGQSRTISAFTATSLSVSEDWDTTPDTTSVYLVGAVRWKWRSGILRFKEPEEQKQRDAGAFRQLRMAWKPTVYDARFFLRRYLNHSETAETNASSRDFGDGLSAAVDETELVQQMLALRDDTLAAKTAAQGFTNFQFEGMNEDNANVDRWVTLELEGFQCREQIVIYSLEIRGVD